MLLCFKAHASLSGAFSTSLESGGDVVFGSGISAGVSETSKLNGAQGLSLNAGFLIDTSTNNSNSFQIQTTIGAKFVRTQPASDGAIMSWYRFPVEALVFYHNSDIGIRVGGGICYHVANKLSGTRQYFDLSETFNDAVGAVGQIDYVGNLDSKSRYTIGLRYINLEYVSQKYDGRTLNANGYGLVIGLY